MTLLGSSTYTVTRQPGAWGTDGTWSSTGSPTTFDIVGSPQVVTAHEAELLPIGARTSARLVLYVEADQTELRTSDINGQTAADRIKISGVDYVVLSVADWTQHTALRHRAYALAEVGDDE